MKLNQSSVTTSYYSVKIINNITDFVGEIRIMFPDLEKHCGIFIGDSTSSVVGKVRRCTGYPFDIGDKESLIVYMNNMLHWMKENKEMYYLWIL